MTQEKLILVSDYPPRRVSALHKAHDVLNIQTPAEIDQLTRVYDALPAQTRAILESEWGNSEDQGADTVRLELTNFADIHTDLESKLTLAARTFISTRIAIRKQSGFQPVVSVDVGSLIKQMNDTNGIEHASDIVVSIADIGQVSAEFVVKQRIDTDKFESTSFAELPGSNVAVIGIGGGSDGCQAAQEALCMKRAGKHIRGVFDVRRIKDSTPEKIKQLDEAIREQHAGERVGNTNAWRMTKEISGIESLFSSGRFMTHVPASDVPMYLVLDDIDGVDTADTIHLTLAHIGDVDAVYAADTGGDSLFPATASNDLGIAHTTPDQDLAVLQALDRVRQRMGADVYFGSTIIAPGIDVPSDATERLNEAKAQFLSTSEDDAKAILELYQKWDMTGSNPSRFGVTPFVWQLALRGEVGVQVLPLPIANILNKQNPWNPFRIVQPGMNGIFIMSLEKHIRSISK